MQVCTVTIIALFLSQAKNSKQYVIIQGSYLILILHMANDRDSATRYPTLPTRYTYTYKGNQLLGGSSFCSSTTVSYAYITKSYHLIKKPISMIHLSLFYYCLRQMHHNVFVLYQTTSQLLVSNSQNFYPFLVFSFLFFYRLRMRERAGHD